MVTFFFFFHLINTVFICLLSVFSALGAALLPRPLTPENVRLLQVRLYPLPDQEHLSQEHLSAAESSAVCSGVEATTDANR